MTTTATLMDGKRVAKELLDAAAVRVQTSNAVDRRVVAQFGDAADNVLGG